MTISLDDAKGFTVDDLCPDFSKMSSVEMVSALDRQQEAWDHLRRVAYDLRVKLPTLEEITESANRIGLTKEVNIAKLFGSNKELGELIAKRMLLVKDEDPDNPESVLIEFNAGYRVF